jgi:hypothetical protein
MVNPNYILESCFRGVPDDAKDRRCHFRRYVVDVYLENACASSGCFKLQNVNEILYYFSDLPLDGIELWVDAETDQRGGAYNGVGFFTTTGITVKWQSQKPVDARASRQKIATLLFCFSKWGMSYSEIESRKNNEIIIPDPNFKARADDSYATVDELIYKGAVIEEEKPYTNPALKTVQNANEVLDFDFGELYCRFAVFSDSHIGKRYNWADYNWLYGAYNNLEKIHKNSPLDFVLELGDNIDDGYLKTYKEDYSLYLDVVKNLKICDAQNPVEGRAKYKIPHYEMWGNHDTSPDTRFFREKLWYTQNENGTKTAFIAFFAKYGGYPAVKDLGVSYKSFGILTNEMVEFLEKSILEAKQNGAEHIVLSSHFGISQDLEAPILPESGLGKIESLCKKYNIKLYLSGHEHNKEYTLRKYNSLYNYDASMTKEKYSVFELYKKYAKVTVYNTNDNSVSRIDVIEL